MSRRSGACLRCCLVIFAVVSALAVCGPALYWRFKKALQLGDSKTSCAPCICDCPPPLSLLKIAPGIIFYLCLSIRANGFSCGLLCISVFVRLVVEFSEINRYPFEEFGCLIRFRWWFGFWAVSFFACVVFKWLLKS